MFTKPLERRVHGFTLTELVVIMVIAGILAAVAIPRFAGKTGYEARGFYDEMSAAARYAQKLAIATGCPVTFTVTAGAGGNYALTRPADQNCGGGAEAVTRPDGAANFSRTANSTVTITITAGASPVVFTPAGAASNTLSVQISGGGFTDSFTIHAATGYVGAL